MKYSVMPSYVDNEFVWNLYEVASEQIVGRFFFEEDAVDFAEFYESGGGFDGFTPPFILNSVPRKFDSMNDAFESIFDEP